MAELLRALENADSRPPRNWELQEMSTNCYKKMVLLCIFYCKLTFSIAIN
jgi:hypothetical protein